ncbi:MAG: alginate lyase family protein [Flaviaesturariibacter sp.]|nr:alginate lyase family protein [Flaviaesturariibacter sp.]
MMRLLVFLACFLSSVCVHAQHPLAFATREDYAGVRSQLGRSLLLNGSFTEIKKQVDPWLGRDIDVPTPKDPAGGYTHEQHKSNYTLLFNSGLLFNLTGDSRYADLVRRVLLKYAQLNPGLGNHPQATSSSPGRIFWQALNDANWLVYMGMAYDAVYNAIPPADRQTIEDGAFRPEVEFMTRDLKSWFDLIHNHGVWACAGVGIVGIATNNADYLDMALYGTDKKGTSGFLAQLNGLFSPDGYYTEGPYYVRYAILPFYVFANALSHARPALNIFGYRGQILRKALEAGLQQTNTDGRFLPINDALKEKDYTSNEIVTAIDIAWAAYGPNEGLLSVARRQNRVTLSKGGAAIAAALDAKKAPTSYPYRSVEYTDGAKGEEGGVSILRAGKGSDLTTVVFKYASHGLSHGHYDQLGFSLFDKGAEIFTDYGSVRFIGIEQKFGGRYLPENKSYAAQTIAHNTLVVDEKSQFDGREEEAEKYHGEKLFSGLGTGNVQAVSARDDHAYPDVRLQRSLYLVVLPAGRKMVIDLFRAQSQTVHQYDQAFPYSGQLINTSFRYQPSTSTQKPVGAKNGYQYLWKEAEARVGDTVAQVSFLNGRSFYTVSTLVSDSAQVFLARTGANDPNFNLRREPSVIIRRRGVSPTILNVIELHGSFDPIGELATSSYPAVSGMRLLVDNADVTVAEITVGKDVLLIAQRNVATEASAPQEALVNGKMVSWKGGFGVWVNGKVR